MNGGVEPLTPIHVADWDAEMGNTLDVDHDGTPL